MLMKCIVERWASGLMDHVHKKRVETIKRRREAEALLGTPGVSKPFGPQQKNANSPNRLPILSGLTALSAPHHSRKRSLVSGQLARLFDDSSASSGSTTPVAQPGPKGGAARPGSAGGRSLTSSDNEMLGTRPASSRRTSTSRHKPTREAMLNHEDKEDGVLEGAEHSPVSTPSSFLDNQVAQQAHEQEEADEGRDSPSKAIELAAPDRPYTKWRGE